MEWINVEDKHFIDITYLEDGSYLWIENNNCPREPFLVGLYVGNNKTGVTKFDTYLVVLGDKAKENEFEIESIKTGEKEIYTLEELIKRFK